MSDYAETRKAEIDREVDGICKIIERYESAIKDLRARADELQVQIREWDKLIRILKEEKQAIEKSAGRTICPF